MEKAKHSLVRIERIDGTTVASGLTGDDPDELLAMIGDAMAFWLHDNPRKWRTARKLMRRVFHDFCPDWLAYWIDGWALRLVGIGGIFAALYGFAALMQKIGGAFL